ncbi:DUF4190 domain-containing protein [Cohnella hongkongensis]|uniref:DUF4190 domain-containing protein n=1 Tax=Cohnella hongkongensis TaxID=178337 RepID=A0ABV9FLE2_9BACL
MALEPYSQGSQHYGFTPPPPHAPPKTNGKSIAALVLGILAVSVPYIGFLIGIVAIVFASLALKEIRQTHEQGRGMAIAGLVCGIVGTAIYAFLLLLFLLAFVTFAEWGSSFVYS